MLRRNIQEPQYSITFLIWLGGEILFWNRQGVGLHCENGKMRNQHLITQWNGLHRCPIRGVLLYFHYCKNWYNLQCTRTLPTELLYFHYCKNWYNLQCTWTFPTELVYFHYCKKNWYNLQCTRTFPTELLSGKSGLNVWHDPVPTLRTCICIHIWINVQKKGSQWCPACPDPIPLWIYISFCTYVWIDVQEFIVLSGMIQIRLSWHGYVGQVLLYGKEIPTPGQVTQ